MFSAYADKNEYFTRYMGEVLTDEDADRYLQLASQHIDSLTYNRIVSQGFLNLTGFQQGVIKKVCCMQAEFEHENRELFDMILSGYSINGVSMQFGESWNVAIEKGIPMKRDVYELLRQTGLCCRLAC